MGKDLAVREALSSEGFLCHRLAEGSVGREGVVQEVRKYDQKLA